MIGTEKDGGKIRRNNNRVTFDLKVKLKLSFYMVKYSDINIINQYFTQ